MFKMVSSLCTILLCSGCGASSAPHVQQAYQVINEHVSLQKKRGYFPFGVGGSMYGQVQVLHVDYEIIGRVSLKDARRIIVQLVDELLDIANRSNGLRPYMICYPFVEENVRVGINYVDKKGEYYLEPFVAQVYATNGKIFYSGCDSKTGFLSLDSFFEETVEEARAILAAEQEASCSQ